ncbi:pyridoxamine 5-phosphate oxidase [Deinococcus sp. KSM4-11]|uniref:MSMEG_1061 family FMN-dependent PPOX-type flavoprotein n=1 Tax=Deinococcus sp. KSM4-11 TaxID=2568654 RepID=UPI0010A3879E|nr:MSMEG_1061 family FMN-dependent PPOX-type flavoprotein [Deinococcus sp. KSM4-11]THF85426.1 pyridoxamine 5-phosphate oxidase [Deinococcus sp. KSM4-11]
MNLDPEFLVQSDTDLAGLYRPPSTLVIRKVMNYLDADFQRIIAAAPLVLLATHGETGVDCSPRGDPGQAAFVDDPHTLVLPDRPGNNRIDSIRNILHDPQVGLLFLVPGVNEGFRVNGVARLTRDPAVLERYAYLGRPPVTLIVVEVHEAFLHCARALLRSDIWNLERRSGPVLPNFAQMLSQQVQAAVRDQDLAVEDDR